MDLMKPGEVTNYHLGIETAGHGARSTAMTQLHAEADFLKCRPREVTTSPKLR